jgi:hypothetical protein
MIHEQAGEVLSQPERKGAVPGAWREGEASGFSPTGASLPLRAERFSRRSARITPGSLDLDGKGLESTNQERDVTPSDRGQAAKGFLRALPLQNSCQCASTS